MVRIRLPPAVSRQTIGSSAAEQPASRFATARVKLRREYRQRIVVWHRLQSRQRPEQAWSGREGADAPIRLIGFDRRPASSVERIVNSIINLILASRRHARQSS